MRIMRERSAKMQIERRGRMGGGEGSDRRTVAYLALSGSGLSRYHAEGRSPVCSVPWPGMSLPSFCCRPSQSDSYGNEQEETNEQNSQAQRHFRIPVILFHVEARSQDCSVRQRQHVYFDPRNHLDIILC